MGYNPALRPQVFGDEPAFSWFLRWAGMQGYPSAPVFARSLGISIYAIYSGLANAHLARAAGFPEDTFDLNTITRRSNGDAAFRALRFAGIDLSARVTRFCLECVRSDLGTPLRPGEPRARFRTGWLMQCINACPVHGVLLTEAGKSGSRLRRYPQEILRDIDRSGPIPDARRSQAAEADAEAYILGRMGLGTAVPCAILDACHFHELPRLLESVGTLVLRQHSMGNQNLVYNAGFNALRTEASFDRFLDGLSASHREDAKRYSPLLGYSRLARAFGTKPYGDRLLPVRQAVARHVRENAGGAGYLKEVYGVAVTPRLYRLTQVCERTGRSRTWCLKVLRLGGFLDADDPGEFVDVDTVRRFEEFLSGLMNMNETVAVLGMTIPTVREIVDDGILKPWAGGANSRVQRKLFRRSEVEGLVAAVRQGNQTVYDTPPSGLITLRQATNYMGVTYCKLIPSLMSGRIRCRGLLQGREGIEAVLVTREDAIGFAPRNGDAVTSAEVCRMLSLSNQSMKGLGESGRLGPSERKGRRLLYKRAIVEEFNRRFISVAEAARSLQTHATTVRYPLAKQGVEPSFRVTGGNWFYDRRKIEEMLERLGPDAPAILAPERRGRKRAQEPDRSN